MHDILTIQEERKANEIVVQMNLKSAKMAEIDLHKAIFKYKI